VGKGQSIKEGTGFAVDAPHPPFSRARKEREGPPSAKAAVGDGLSTVAANADIIYIYIYIITYIYIYISARAAQAAPLAHLVVGI